MSGFALNLDLSYYYEDLRKFSCVFVDVTKSKTVGDVENHIKDLFKLDENICITTKKFLIPRCESIKILQQYEILKVQKCDFFDHQIHKNEIENTASDINQTALNLIQSERSIDLSCRPKQRLKINLTKPHCTSEDFFPISQNHKIHNISYPPTSFSGVTQSKEKIKHKKKKSIACELNNAAENDVDILDMSLNKTEVFDYSCFENYHDDNSTHSRSVSFENNAGLLSQESEMKSKKRSKKKQKESNEIQGINEVVVEDNSFRKKKRNSSKYEIDADIEAEDYTTSKKQKRSTYVNTDYSVFDTPRQNNDQNSSLDFCLKNKRKKVKEFVDNCVSGDSKLKKVEESIENFSINGEHNSVKDLDTGTIQKIEDNLRHGIEINGETNHTINGETNEVCTENGFINCSESNNDQDSLTYSEFLEPKLKNKRVRKHRKRRKQGKQAVSQSMLSAVGPILGMLDGHSAPGPVVHQITTPRTGQHIYFNDNDFDDEMTIPLTPPNETSQPQAYSQTLSNATQVAVNKDEETDVLPTWKQQLLKLAASPKPVVFHRGSPDQGRLDVLKTKGDPTTPALSVRSSTMKLTTNNDKQLGQSVQKSQSSDKPDQVQENANIAQDNKSTNSRQSLDGHSMLHNEFDKKTEVSDCNIGIEPVNGTCSDKDDSASAKRIPPIPSDVQSINLSNYPIIDKVISDDLILFKVLKLNEQYQPDCSKTILAKVNSTTEYPDKINLQIIEGSEECGVFLNEMDKNGEHFNVQLRWTDIIEPRLFYP